MAREIVPSRVEALSLAADRLDELADTAALMGDPDSAERWHAAAAAVRERAMHLLDHPPSRAETT